MLCVKTCQVAAQLTCRCWELSASCRARSPALRVVQDVTRHACSKLLGDVNMLQTCYRTSKKCAAEAVASSRLSQAKEDNSYSSQDVVRCIGKSMIAV